MFVDTVKLQLIAGKGGNGVIAWRREKFVPKGGPAGGNGSKGGSIIFKATPQIFSLEHLRNRRIVKAENGGSGGPNNRQGKTGEDQIITVPLGTLIKDARTDEVLADLTEKDQEAFVCQGGKGGKGNNFFKSSTHQAPHKCTEGKEGELREVVVELKLIADIGLIGMPNAGKSTLISKITHLPVKIAPYPFTTLVPNLGLFQREDYHRILIADIPGIIKDAHNDRGLGLSFLKHIERTSILFFVIDISGSEGRDPWEDFLLLRNELKEYNEELLQKPFIVLLNKIDVEEAAEKEELFRKSYPFADDTLFSLSGLTGEGMPALIKWLNTTTLKARQDFCPKSSPSLQESQERIPLW